MLLPISNKFIFLVVYDWTAINYIMLICHFTCLCGMIGLPFGNATCYNTSYSAVTNIQLIRGEHGLGWDGLRGNPNPTRTSICGLGWVGFYDF